MSLHRHNPGLSPVVAQVWAAGVVAEAWGEGWAKEWDEAKAKAVDEVAVAWARVVVVVWVLRAPAINPPGGRLPRLSQKVDERPAVTR